jgi:leader peptidase (prepilin peptidase) / N-methyltransferase
MLVLGTVLCGIVGAVVGSFANVVVMRHGFAEARRARSGCMACGTKLHWFELVPILSFFFLRGHCRSCGSGLSLQYPLVEFTLGTLFALSFYTAYPIFSVFEWLFFLLTLVFLTIFLILTVYDIKHTLVPYAFSLPLIGTALCIRAVEWALFQETAVLIDALGGGVIFAGFLLILYFVTRGRGMGLGDVYVALAIGIVFGMVKTIDVIVLSFWIGGALGLVLIALKKGFKMKSEVPFVPFLFVATIIGMFTHFSPLSFLTALIATV